MRYDTINLWEEIKKYLIIFNLYWIVIKFIFLTQRSDSNLERYRGILRSGDIVISIVNSRIEKERTEWNRIE